MNVLSVAMLFCVLTGVSPDTYHLARAIDGERPGLVCPNLDNSECMALAQRIGQVAYNRLQDGWCESMEECVANGFWGAKNVTFPKPWAIAAAQAVLEERVVTDDRYVFSYEDVEKLGLSLEDATWHVGRAGWVFGLAFYDESLEF